MTPVPAAIPVPMATFIEPAPMALPMEDDMPVPQGLTAAQTLRHLESLLSSLMDTMAFDGWTINPAYHPRVSAFIQQHSNNSMFSARAESLRRNRAAYYAKTLAGHATRQTVLARSRGTVVDAAAGAWR